MPIQSQSLLKVADNSGAKIVKCIKILGSLKKKASIGDVILITVKNVQNNINFKKILKPKKKEIFKALVLRTSFSYKNLNGFYIKFGENSVALLDKQKNPLGTRINGFLPKSLKTKFNKFIIMTKLTI